jgi:hypothetical protein
VKIIFLSTGEWVYNLIGSEKFYEDFVVFRRFMGLPDVSELISYHLMINIVDNNRLEN